MKPYDYQQKPEIKSPKDLLNFLKPIPARFWCVDIRNNGRGQCCVLGHLDIAYGYAKGRDGFADRELARANNGGSERDIHYREPGIKTTGAAIKARVLSLIRKRIGK